LEVCVVASITGNAQMLGKSLQCLHVNTFNMFATRISAHDHKPLIIDENPCTLTALLASRLVKLGVNGAERFDKRVDRWSFGICRWGLRLGRKSRRFRIGLPRGLRSRGGTSVKPSLILIPVAVA
jgi:hypothetical protein